MTQTRMIEIARIDAGDRLRALDPDWVALLAEEIAAEGQHSAIRVVERDDGFRLVDGGRRLAAIQQLGRAEIEARVEPAQALIDDAAIRLGEIKGNMLRGELTALDHAVFVAAWCDVYRGAHDTPKRGPKKAAPRTDEELEELSADAALNWTEAAQRALHIGRRSVFVALKIASIDRGLTRRIALLSVAKRQSDLLLLANMTPARQRDVVDLLTADPAEAASVTEALALLDSLPAPKPVPVYQRAFDRLAAMKPSDQDQFFKLTAGQYEVYREKSRAASARKAIA